MYNIFRKTAASQNIFKELCDWFRLSSTFFLDLVSILGDVLQTEHRRHEKTQHELRAGKINILSALNTVLADRDIIIMPTKSITSAMFIWIEA